MQMALLELGKEQLSTYLTTLADVVWKANVLVWQYLFQVECPITHSELDSLTAFQLLLHNVRSRRPIRKKNLP